MQELRYVGPGEDADHVLVETADGERYTLCLDHELRAGIAPVEPPTPTPTPTKAPSSAPRPTLAPVPQPATLSPREIQTRVRAGESAQTLADESAMSLERVLVFANPVLDERARVTGEARRARARRSTPDGQLVDFGPAVDERFAAHGIDPADVSWDSRRRDDGQWVIAATWRGGDSERTADWLFALGPRSVTPLDETAGDLLSDRPIRPIVQAVPDLPTPLPGPPDALTGPLPPMGDDFFDQDAELPAAPLDPPAKLVDASAARPPAHVHPAHVHPAPVHPAPVHAEHEEPSLFEDLADPLPLPLQFTEPVPAVLPPRASADETDEQKAARARIPSWDDILLGVRRKRD